MKNQVHSSKRWPINERDSNGMTALHRAAVNGDTDTALQLCEEGANKELLDGRGCTALHWAAINGKSNIVRALCVKGAEKDTVNRDGETALHLAASQGNTVTVRVLCEQGANKDIVDASGYTPLHHAALKGDDDTVRVLCEHGSNKNAVDKSGFTALHWAVLGKHTEVIRVLLKAGARYDIRDKKGATPMDVARDRGYLKIAQFLQNYTVAIEVAFSPYAKVAEPGTGVLYPAGNEQTNYGTQYAMGIIAQFNSSQSVLNPVMQKVLSYLPTLSKHDIQDCMNIASARVQQNSIEDHSSSNQISKKCKAVQSNSAKQRRIGYLKISEREVKELIKEGGDFVKPKLKK